MARKAMLVLMAFGLVLASCENPLASSLSNRNLLEYRTDGNENLQGYAPADPTRYPQGSLVELLGNTRGMSRGNARFAGWALQPNAAAVAFSPGQRVVIGAQDLVLYPVWLPTTGLHVTYDRNDATTGQVPVDNQVYNEGDSVIVPGNPYNLSKIGSVFIGWSLSAEGEAPIYGQGTSIAMPAGGLRLYARFRSEGSAAFVLSYDGNGATGGSPPASPALYPPGQDVIVAGNSGGFVRSGLSFAGWNTKPDGSGISYAPMQHLQMPSHDVRLFAQWHYAIEFDANGADSGIAPPPIFFKPGESVYIPSSGLGKVFHQHIGWSENKEANYASFQNGISFTPEARNYRLYAVWERDSYYLSFDPNGAVAGSLPPPTLCQWGNVITLPAPNGLTGPAPAVYFSHYSTLPSGPGGDNRLPGETYVMPQNDLTFYARWASPGQRVAGFTSLAGGVINDIVELNDGDIVIAGNFTQYGTLNTRRHLVRLNADLSVDTDNTFNFAGFGFDGEVKSVAYDYISKRLYVVGNFTKYNNASTYRFACLDAVTGDLAPVILNVTLESDDLLNAIAYTNDTYGFVIGGSFSVTDGSFTATNLARFLITGELQSEFNPNISQEVIALEAEPSAVYYLCKNSNEVRKLKVSDGSDQGQLFNLSAFMYNAGTFARDNSGLLVGGSFIYAAGYPRGNLARLLSNSNLDMNFLSDPGADGEVHAILVPSNGKSIVIGGAFLKYDGKSSPFLARVYRSLP